MTSFLIGKLLEPEVRRVKTKEGNREVTEFAILSGKYATQFSIWDDAKCYGKLQALKDGQAICAIVGDGLDNQGRVRHYVNDISICPDAFRSQLRALFDAK